MGSYQPTWSKKSISKENLWWLFYFWNLFRKDQMSQSLPCAGPSPVNLSLWLWGLSNKAAWVGWHSRSGSASFISILPLPIYKNASVMTRWPNKLNKLNYIKILMNKMFCMYIFTFNSENTLIWNNVSQIQVQYLSG